jgi:hypothetical protein
MCPLCKQKPKFLIKRDGGYMHRVRAEVHSGMLPHDIQHLHYNTADEKTNEKEGHNPTSQWSWGAGKEMFHL